MSSLTLHNVYRNWTDRLMLRAGSAVARQVGAIPYTVVDGQVAFVIITSRRSGRWIFPKGALIDGLTPWQTAARETFEEAGLEGEVETEPLGSYRTIKTLSIRRAVIEVDMYPLRVTRQLDEWPEKGVRHRHWVILPDARRLLSDKRLVELAGRLQRRVLGT